MARRFAIVALVLVAGFVAGCAKQVVPMPASTAGPAPATGVAVAPVPVPAPAPTASRAPSSTNGVQRPTGATGEGTRRAGGTRPEPKNFTPVADLPDIYFDFDRYTLRPSAERILVSHATWLRSQQSALVIIEGHSDERGTEEYNLALGERRAKAAMTYLVSRGVDARRLTIISYGEHQPQCRQRDEACWASNRRARFLVNTD